MNLFLIVLKASCIMGAAAIVSALRHRRSSASFRHLVWALAVEDRDARRPRATRGHRQPRARHTGNRGLDGRYGWRR